MSASIAATAARRAGFVSRLAAFLIDAVLLATALRGTAWFLLAAQHALRGFARHQLNIAAIMFAIVPFVSAAFDVVFWRLYGQTPGKWLMGIKIVQVDGGAMTTRNALIRFIGYLLSALPFYAGFLWILGPQRRGWHDRLAGTEVVYTARRPRLQFPEPLGSHA
jgi:uncharacterized RDD family membrane protein YckC